MIDDAGYVPFAGMTAGSDVPVGWHRITLASSIVNNIAIVGGYTPIETGWRSFGIRWTNNTSNADLASIEGVIVNVGEVTFDDGTFAIVHRRWHGHDDLLFCPGILYADGSIHRTIDDYVDVFTDFNDLILATLREAGWRFDGGYIPGTETVFCDGGDACERRPDRAGGHVRPLRPRVHG